MTLAIFAIISVPLTAIIADELRIPLRISNNITAARRLQSSTSILSEDATSAQSFSAGIEPDYGTFSWLELVGPAPVQLSARYYWKEGSLFRQMTRNADAGQSFQVIEGITEYSDIVFTHTPPTWTYDPVAKRWSYTNGRVAIGLDATSESTADFRELVRSGRLVADFRPQLERPEVFPDPPQ